MTNRSLNRVFFGVFAAAAFGCASSPSSPKPDAGIDGGALDSAQADLPSGDVEPIDTQAAESGAIDGGSDALQGVLVDDFEDGNAKTTYPGGSWYTYDDKSNGGGSAISYAMNGVGYQSTRSLEVIFTFDQKKLPYQPYVGWGMFFSDNTEPDKTPPLDISKFQGIAYVYRGNAHRIRIETFEIADYDYYGMAVAASDTWKTVIVPFSQMGQEGFGKKKALNLKNVGNISFQARGNTGVKGTIDMDNIMLLTSLPNQAPDMVIMPPSPPKDDPIASIVIPNPLQARAMQYLTRGYNITNWLEQDRFAGFTTYNEAFVAKLAAAGFKSLRLPVDLDRYIVSGTAPGGIDGGAGIDGGEAMDASGGIDAAEVPDVELHPDLFLILDSFEQWTAKYGISLTIDYHQYDTSIDKAKPETLARVVAVWGKVAAHFASNPRLDLFYELLNEAELSMAGVPPTQDELTAFAERMIASIRASDKVHSIIFGDVKWYGIVPLSQRTPLSDTNVIYAFHDYEPFIFTHQGAGWAGMGSTHDLPYPYDQTRWSRYFGDLGFNKSMDAWILQAARDYYTKGNKPAVRNLILKAKQWAVDHNVPVICNEFGAYDGTSRMEDRARYLTDVIAIFEELEIPWQQWFMIMDDAGTVAPEYAAAMHLKP
jgi:licheninase